MTGCDFCGKRVKGDNTDSWAGKLPMPSVPLTDEELEKNPKLQRPKYSITITVACSVCTSKIGDFLVKLAR